MVGAVWVFVTGIGYRGVAGVAAGTSILRRLTVRQTANMAMVTWGSCAEQWM